MRFEEIDEVLEGKLTHELQCHSWEEFLYLYLSQNENIDYFSKILEVDREKFIEILNVAISSIGGKEEYEKMKKRVNSLPDYPLGANFKENESKETKNGEKNNQKKSDEINKVQNDDHSNFDDSKGNNNDGGENNEE